MPSYWRHLAVTAATLLVWTAAVCAGEPEPPTAEDSSCQLVVEAVYVDLPPVIDGRLDDECWSKASRLEEFTCNIVERPVPEQTTALVCLDENAIYVGFICRDRTPEDIVARETRRNGEIYNDDFVEFEIDPWHQHAQTYAFRVTSRGTQWEYIPGGSATKIEWRGDWSAAALRTEEGWQAEMAIPFSILRYPPEQTTFGLDVSRRFAAEDLRAFCPDMGRVFDPTRAANLIGLDLPPRSFRPVLMPYVTVDLGEAVGRSFDAGLDAQYTFPNGLTALATLNPDFTQIEDVVEPISFSYTERWLPELRPFFVTGEHGYLPPGNLLYTRNIEDFDVGVKLYGTVGNETIGFLDAATFSEENALAAAWRHRYDEENSVRVMLVSHQRPEDPDNLSYGVSASSSRRMADGEGSDDLWVDLFQSRSQGAESGGSYALGGGRSRGEGVLHYGWHVTAVTDSFGPSLGFSPETDYYGGGFNLGLWDYREEGALDETSWGFGGSYFPYLEADGLFRGGIWGNHFWSWRRGTVVSLGFNLGEREGDGNSDVNLNYRWNRKDTYRGGSLRGTRGKRDGGDYTYYSVEQGFRPRECLSVNVNVEFSELTEPAEDPGRHYQAVLTTSYDLTPEKSLAARLIQSDDGFRAYASYRQVVRRGMDAYVILGDPDPDRTGLAKRVAFKLIWVL